MQRKCRSGGRGCSLDIDIPQLQDVFRNAGVANVPSLAFYSHGEVDRMLVGVRESDVIIDYIETWLVGDKPDIKAVNRSRR